MPYNLAYKHGNAIKSPSNSFPNDVEECMRAHINIIVCSIKYYSEKGLNAKNDLETV